MPIEFDALSGADIQAVAVGGLRLTGFGLGMALANDEAVGNGNLSLHGNGSAYEEGVAPPVVIPTGGDSNVIMYGEGVAWVDITCAADGYMPLVGNGYAAENLVAGDTAAFTDGTTGLRGVGYEEIPPQAYGLLIEQPGIMSSYGGVWLTRLIEQAMLGHGIALLPAVLSRGAIVVGAAQETTFEGTLAGSSNAVFTDDAAFVVRMLVEEGVAFSDLSTATFTQIARVISRLVLTGDATNYAEAYTVVLDALVLGALVQALQKGELADTVALNAAVAPYYTLVANLLDRLLLNDAVTPLYTLTALIEERFLLTRDLSHAADLAAVLRDSIGFAVTLGFDNGEYIAWTLNTESSGLSRYTNYPFNSFANIGGRYYGAASDGIHLLEGNDDNEVPIAAKLRLGLNQLGDRKLKRLPDVYIGYSSDGTLLMKVITIDERTGAKQSAIYTLPTRGAIDTRDHKFQPGKGLRSVDWDFEIHNVDGADFDLKSIEFYPLIMDRRTRG